MTSYQLRHNHRALLHYILCAGCACISLASPTTAKAQSQPDRGTVRVSGGGEPRDTTLTEKSPEDARLYGFLFPGGGQYYLGENRHGAAITTKSIALLGTGTLTLLINNCSFTTSDQGQCTPHRHVGQLAIGSLLIAAGAWVWAEGALEAGRSAQQIPTGHVQSGTTLRPFVDTSPGGSMRLGLSIAAGP
jgi:hypothetical protein